MQNASEYPRLVALPVLECIDCVSDVGGVDQAPQYVVVVVVDHVADSG
ncbi:hypothetical protein CDCE8392_1570 [Corynebacterium diphtheriae CDCE 8392]|nr:hypothetical protein CDCE8392_1570 [Corynebacterium diphtheriae CDCE 8392]